MIEPVDQGSGIPVRSPVVRFAAVFLIVIVLFCLIEILPLHFGSRALPWPALWPEVKSRLPRILLIGVGAALFLTIGRKGGASRQGTDGVP